MYPVSSKMLHSITPSLSVVSSQTPTSKSAESSSSIKGDGSVFLEFNEDVEKKLLNLSSTLQKLYIWEKKLYEEIKVCYLNLYPSISVIFFPNAPATDPRKYSSIRSHRNLTIASSNLNLAQEQFLL